MFCSMAALASCAPSTVVAAPTSSILSVNSFVFFSGNALKILFALLNATPIGSISVAPTPAPSREAFVRSSCVAPASLALSLASPAPAPTANAPAAGIPTVGIKDSRIGASYFSGNRVAPPRAALSNIPAIPPTIPFGSS